MIEIESKPLFVHRVKDHREGDTVEYALRIYRLNASMNWEDIRLVESDMLQSRGVEIVGGTVGTTPDIGNLAGIVGVRMKTHPNDSAVCFDVKSLWPEERSHFMDILNEIRSTS